MIHRITLCCSLLFVAMLCHTASAAKLPDAVKRDIDFTRDVQPIFAEHCLKCHGEEKPKGKFRLDVRQSIVAGGDSGEPGIAIGKSADSHLIKLVAELTPGEVMPPKGKALSDEQIGILRAWIDQGAKWADGAAPVDEAGPKMLKGDHWSLQPVKKVVAPKVKHQDWVKSPIDALVAAKLEAQGLSPSPMADKATLVRRAYLVLTGLPPTPAQLKAHLADERADAWPRLIDELLARPQYGERWARHWLDVARFAETNGFETNTPRPNAWHYRDYVIRSFNEDKPYDQFVREQIAGDALGEDAGTGFLVAGPWDEVKSPDIGLTLMQRSDELHDIVNTTSTAFLGLTVACARCHNHKFDPISQKDYFAFQGVFAGVNHGNRAMRTKQDAQVEARQAAAQAKLDAARAALAKIEASQSDPALKAPQGATGAVPRTIIIDDQATSAVARAIPLIKVDGPGQNPAGTAKGHRDDPGDIDRMPNISGGMYSVWHYKPNQDFIAYHPNAAGRFRIWVSWGAGFQSHASTAQYVLDLDGDLNTRDDQRVLATVDQRHFAGDQANKPAALSGKPLWSGLLDVGVHELNDASRIILRSTAAAAAGEAGNAAITADVVVLQDEPAAAGNDLVAATHPRLRDPVNGRFNEERFPAQQAKFVRFTILATNGGQPCIDELEIYAPNAEGQPPRNVALGAKPTSSGDLAGFPIHKLSHINDGKAGNDHSWISNTLGNGWVQLEFPGPTWFDRINWGRDRTMQFGDRVATNYRIEISNDAKTWVTVASSQDRVPFGVATSQLPAYRFARLPADQMQKVRDLMKEIGNLERDLAVASARPTAYIGNFSQPAPTRRLFRGDPMAPREVVAPGALEVFETDLELTPQTPEQKRRVALADWMTAKDHPLTARVMVNRIWQHHFGTGIVDTPSDFGRMGSKPMHPELLDWLATEFVRSGWSIKHMQKVIMMSSVWRQSSQPREEPLKIDADTRLLWRFPPQRLEAEAIRDSILAVTGSLNERMGGPGWNAFEDNANYVRVYKPKEKFTEDDLRRMVYMYKVRMEHDATFGAFDCPDAGQPTAKRTSSTTAIQALSLFNSPLVMEQANVFARSLTAAAGDDAAAQVREAYQRCFGRAPTPQESGGAVSFIGQHGLPAFCRAMLNSNEFLFVP